MITSPQDASSLTSDHSPRQVTHGLIVSAGRQGTRFFGLLSCNVGLARPDRQNAESSSHMKWNGATTLGLSDSLVKSGMRILYSRMTTYLWPRHNNGLILSPCTRAHKSVAFF